MGTSEHKSSTAPRVVKPERSRPTDTDALWVVVPCMGRLTFLKQTLPGVVAQSGVRYCLVDYACPEGCGGWVARCYPSEVRGGRIAVERVRGLTYFNKSRANNRGAARAIGEGARFLCFLDADTLVTSGFVRWVLRHVEDDRFLIAGLRAGRRYLRSTGGILVVSAAQFQCSDGFDESFQGWGQEDVEIRLRLHLVHGLDYGEIPLRLLSPLPHPDQLRTRFYQQQDHLVSGWRNRERMEKKVLRWTGQPIAQLGPRAKRLDILPPFPEEPEARRRFWLRWHYPTAVRR